MATQASQLSFLETNTGTVNVPNNLYVAGTIYQGGVAIGSGGGGGGGGGSNNNTSTTSALPPLSPRVGDIWYNSASDAVYRYEQDGVGNTYWIDFNGPTGTSGGGSSGSSTPFTGGTVASYTAFQNSITVATNIIVGTGTNSTASVGLVVATTDAVALPVGTTAQRPVNALPGMIRYNTSSSIGLEVFIGAGTSSGWTSIASPIYTANYLVVGGGGGGGNNGSGAGAGGGGGAGGFIAGTTSLIAGVQYPITVGSGGSVVQTNGGAGSNGGNSVFNGQTAIGGGGGSGAGGGTGGSGGSGGGSSGPTGGAGTPGQGNNGGGVGGGGGGAGGAGQTNSGPSYASGAGGTGLTSAIYSGTNVYYAGGGGGGIGGNAGGLGGGGAAVPGSASGAGVAGVAGTGGGGGAGSQTSPAYSGPAGQPGGSGVVIISYANANQRASGGAVTSYLSGNTMMWVHTFTTSSIFTA